MAKRGQNGAQHLPQEETAACPHAKILDPVQDQNFTADHLSSSLQSVMMHLLKPEMHRGPLVSHT